MTRSAEQPGHVAAAFRFCPSCGGPLHGRRFKAGEPERQACPACGFVHYLDPKLAVGTIIRAGDEGVVLVRRAIEPGYGLWVFPGGYVDRGEVVEEAARREAKEEVGLEIEVDGLVGIYSYAGRTPVLIVYAAHSDGGVLAVDEESIEARCFPLADIPWSELAFRSTEEALRDFADGRVYQKLRYDAAGIRRHN